MIGVVILGAVGLYVLLTLKSLAEVLPWQLMLIAVGLFLVLGIIIPVLTEYC